MLDGRCERLLTEEMRPQDEDEEVGRRREAVFLTPFGFVWLPPLFVGGRALLLFSVGGSRVPSITGVGRFQNARWNFVFLQRGIRKWSARCREKNIV